MLSKDFDPKLIAKDYIDAARLFYQNKHFKKAIVFLNKAIDFDPLNCESFRLLGDIFISTKSYKKALLAYDNAIKLYPDFSLYYVLKGKTFFHLGRHENAIREYNKALEIDSDDVFANIKKAESLILIKKFEEALQCTDSAINELYEVPGFYRFPSDGHEDDLLYSHSLKGTALFHLKKYGLAKVEYQKALDASFSTEETKGLINSVKDQLDKINKIINGGLNT